MNEEQTTDVPRRFEELSRKLEARLGKANDEIAGMRWYARISPFRSRRLSGCDKGLEEARKLWRDGDSTAAVALLETSNERYPSAIGLVHGMSRNRKHRKEVYETRKTDPAYVNDGREARALGSAHIGGMGGGGGA